MQNLFNYLSAMFKNTFLFIKPTLFLTNWLHYHYKLWYLFQWRPLSGNTKGGSITVLFTSCLTGLESAVWQLTIFLFICKTDYFKPVKQEVNGTMILPSLVFPASVINDSQLNIMFQWQCLLHNATFVQKRKLGKAQSQSHKTFLS